MYQGTTPTIQFAIPGKNLTEARVFLTIEDRKGQNEITWKSGDAGMRVEYQEPNTLILLELTQEETFQLQLGSVVAQVRWIDANGKAWATEQCKLTVLPVLLNEVITYDG